MKLSDVVSRMPGWYQAGISVYLRSAPGIGKTETLESAPEVIGKKLGKNLGYVTISGPLLTPADAVGYLIPKHVDGHAESIFTDPFWFRTSGGKRLSEYDGGVVIVDEADKTDTDVKKVIGEAALSGRLGPHKLAGGWVMWMAGNRAEDRSGSTKELDHLINRRMEINIQPDMESWTNWAMEHGVLPLTVSFANTHPEVVFTDKVPEKQGPWCTPRSLVRLDRYLQVIAGGDNVPTDPSTLEETAGMIGQAAAATFSAHMKLQQQMPKYEAILKDPDKVKVPEKPDAQMLVCFNLAHRVQFDDLPQVIKYINRYPKEFAVTFANAACKRDAKLVTSPAVQKWCMENASLMAAIAH